MALTLSAEGVRTPDASTEAAKSLRRSRVACGALAVAGVGLRLAIATRPINYPDRFFIPDDTFYTLNIARAMAHGLGPTADGIHLTNGFQPLLAFLMVPVFWVTRDPDAGLRAVMILLSVVDGFLAYALGEVARRCSRRSPDVAALAATSIWAASPLAIAYAIGGLETSLSLLACALLALSWSEARASERPGSYLRTGVLAGLAMMARIDTAALVGALGLWELARWRRGGALRVAIGGAMAIGPWWLYELSRFHTIIPSSGAAVREQVRLHQEDDRWRLTLPRQVGMALGTVLEAMTARVYKLRDYLHDHSTLALALTPIAVLLILAGIVWLVRRGADTMPFRALLGFGLFAWAFYCFYLAATWFFPRYLSPAHVTVVVLLALLLAQISSLLPTRIPRWALGLAVVLLGMAQLPKSISYVTFKPMGTTDDDLEGSKGYREPVMQMVHAAPPGAVIGAFQSGALGYYARAMRDDIRVYNLDGVVDAEAAEAFKARKLGAFARERGITFICDWPFNLENFRRYSGDPRISPEWGGWYRSVAYARYQGGFFFELVEWLTPTQLPPGAPLVATRHLDRDAIDVYAVDDSGTPQMWGLRNKVWKGPRAIGQPGEFPPGAPLAAGHVPGQPHMGLFAVDSSGALAWAEASESGAAKPAQDLSPRGRFPFGGHVASATVAAGRALDLLAIDREGTAWITEASPSGVWKEPMSLEPSGLFPPGAPCAASPRAGVENQLAVWAVDRSGSLEMAESSGEGWSRWTEIGPAGAFPPGAEVTASRHFPSKDQMDLFGVNTAGQLVVLSSRAGDPWSLEATLGPVMDLPPGAAIGATDEAGEGGQTDVIIIAGHGAPDVAFESQGKPWLPPAALGPTWFVPGGSVAAIPEYEVPGKTDIFSIDRSGNLQVASVTHGTWTHPKLIP